MKKEIIDLMAALSPDAPAPTETPKDSPVVQISGDLVSYLEVMLGPVSDKLNINPGQLYELILRKGMNAWFDSLSDSSKAALGVDLKGPSVGGDEFDDEPEDDHLAARAQQAAFEQMNNGYGYTPLTAHGITGGNGKGRGENRSKTNGGAKKSSKKKRGRGPKRSKGPSQSQGSRRRRFSDSRQSR